MMAGNFDFEAFDFDKKNAWEKGGFRRAAGVKEEIGGRGDAREKKREPPCKTECVKLTTEHEMRMAFGEAQLLDAMRYERPRAGVSYHFITWGDVDSLSFLKVCLNWHRLDWLLLSTWCMKANDILQLREWWESGYIGRMDIYVGEIFPGNYEKEWEMLKDFYGEHPEAGRCVSFRNHCKVFAGSNEADAFHFAIESSANVNTNPRTEHGTITVSKELSLFYKDYFDAIEKEEGE